MRGYVIRRCLYMVPTLFAISVVAFLVIQLPPGNFLTAYIAQLSAQGQGVDGAQIRALEERYGLNDPVIVQYWKWISGILTSGDFGQSFQYRRDVADLIWNRIGLTVVLAVSTLLLSWLIAFPVGGGIATVEPSGTSSSTTSVPSSSAPRTSSRRNSTLPWHRAEISATVAGSASSRKGSRSSSTASTWPSSTSATTPASSSALF